MSAGRALIWKHAKYAANTRRILRTQSVFKVMFIAVFVTLMLLGLYAVFLRGFRFLDEFEGLGTLVINRLFSLFFLGMALMLVVSSIVTGYSTLFRSRETPFLLTAPLTPSQITLYKFSDAAGLSSWAFFFIIVPFAGAYARHQGLGPVFALWTFLFSVPFVTLCAGLGALLVLAWVRWMPRGVWVKRVGIVLAVGAAVWVWRGTKGSYDPTGEVYFNVTRLIPGLRLASNGWLPSGWFSEGIVALARGSTGRGLMLFGALTASAATVCVGVEWLGSRTFYDSWQSLEGGRGSERRAPFMLGGLRRCLRFLPRDVQAMLMKDVRMFFRDPMQWSQVLIFFGLLAIYFANLRTFRYHAREDYWRNMMGFLNVFSISAVTCSLASRFVYPQLSMEGQGFWILGLAPTSMKRILLTKFVASAIGLLAVGSGLALLSSLMLEVPSATLWATLGIVAAVSLSVCALSTGLGAVFLDLDQRNPSAIVSGFGGTLNLVVSLLFMFAVIAPFSVVFHLRFFMGMGGGGFRRGVLAAGLWLAFSTLACTVIPLLLGLRSLANRDY